MATIKFIKGYPTKKCLNELIDEFFKNSYSPKVSYGYGRIHHSLNWQNKIDEKMPTFIEYLNNNGVSTGTYRPYDSPCVGMLEIKPKV